MHEKGRLALEQCRASRPQRHSAYFDFASTSTMAVAAVEGIEFLAGERNKSCGTVSASTDHFGASSV